MILRALMKKEKKFESRKNSQKTFKPLHSEPGDFWLDYILLPYGVYYDKTKDFINAKKGDILRFYNGPEYKIDNVSLIKQDRFCDVLCRMRYGIPISAAFRRWARYALLEGNGKDILSKDECFFVVYSKEHEESKTESRSDSDSQ